MGILQELFTWWNGQTLSTRLYTARKGERVGEDELGNVYYRHKKIGEKEKRWVIYQGVAEPSKVPPLWHSWLHHKVLFPPTEEESSTRAWQLPHKPNMTGTAQAYRPKGSLFFRRKKQDDTPVDYEAWSPK